MAKRTDPGIRIPTAKGSIAFKSDKDYDRKKRVKEISDEILIRHSKVFKKLRESGD